MLRVSVSSVRSNYRALHRTAENPLRQFKQPRFSSSNHPGTTQQRTSRFSSTSSSTSSSNKYGFGTLAAVTLLGSAIGYALSSQIQKPSLTAATISSTKQSGSRYQYASESEVKQAIEELRKALPDGAVDTNDDDRQTHGFSENSYHPSFPHAVVVRPNSTEEVSKIMKIATKYRVPVTAYGGGTSLEGHFAGFSSGSICIGMSAMDQIIEINEGDGDLICQSGVQWETVNATLAEKGIPLFFPLDPGPGATIGGMIGTGCSGTNAVKYGTAKGEWFLNVTVVLPNGEVIKTRRRARKSSAGFDTTKFFIGAEGTLGIVTEATLRLAPLYKHKVAMAQFDDVEHAVSAVQELLKNPYGTHIQCVELVDDYTMSAINKAGTVGRAFPVKDSLFFKIQGSDESIKAASRVVQEIVVRHGSTHFEFAASDEEAENLWESRKYALVSTIASVPGSKCWTTDVCVPVSKLPHLVYETKRDIASEGLKAGIVGHVGDGNFHALILFKDDTELPKVSNLVHRLVERALKMDGTCTGEHGVGIGKKEYLVEELGEGTVKLMKRVKDIIDPLHIMNPGKLYPDEPADK